MIWTTEKLNTFFAMKDQGYTLKEIAAELGCTYAAAQSKSHVIKKSKKESTKMENIEKNVGAVKHVGAVSRADILDRAKAIVTGEREKQYGKPEDNFAAIAELWGVYTGHKFSPVDVAMMMVLLKVARIKTGVGTVDSFVDLAGYAACAAEIATASVQPAGDAENDGTSKQSDKINDAQRAE